MYLPSLSTVYKWRREYIVRPGFQEHLLGMIKSKLNEEKDYETVLRNGFPR